MQSALHMTMTSLPRPRSSPAAGAFLVLAFAGGCHQSSVEIEIRVSDELAAHGEDLGAMAFGLHLDEGIWRGATAHIYTCHVDGVRHFWGYDPNGTFMDEGWYPDEETPIVARDQSTRGGPPGCTTYIATPKAWSLPSLSGCTEPPYEAFYYERYVYAALTPYELRVDESTCSVQRAGFGRDTAAPPLLVFELNTWDVLPEPVLESGS